MIEVILSIDLGVKYQIPPPQYKKQDTIKKASIFHFGKLRLFLN